ncbi:MAG: hypothetical protein ACXQTP_00200 [Candidatus Methanofastidiosia archaeon]
MDEDIDEIEEKLKKIEEKKKKVENTQYSDTNPYATVIKSIKKVGIKEQEDYLKRRRDALLEKGFKSGKDVNKLFCDAKDILIRISQKLSQENPNLSGEVNELIKKIEEIEGKLKS